MLETLPNGHTVETSETIETQTVRRLRGGKVMLVEADRPVRVYRTTVSQPRRPKRTAIHVSVSGDKNGRPVWHSVTVDEATRALAEMP